MGTCSDWAAWKTTAPKVPDPSTRRTPTQIDRPVGAVRWSRTSAPIISASQIAATRANRPSGVNWSE